MNNNDGLQTENSRQNSINSRKKTGEKPLMDNVFKEDVSNYEKEQNDSQETDMEEAYYNDFKKRPPPCTANTVSLLSNMLQSPDAVVDTNMTRSSSETSLPESLKQHIALEHSHTIQSMTKNSNSITKGEITSSWNDNFSRW